MQIVTTDRDIMKKELKKVARERDEALSRLAATGHHPDQPANYGMSTFHSYSNNISFLSAFCHLGSILYSLSSVMY